MPWSGNDSFKRKVERCFREHANGEEKLNATSAHAAFIAMGGRSTMPVARVESLLPYYALNASGLISLVGFKKLVDYLQKGHNVADELDAVYDQLVALKARNAALEAELRDKGRDPPPSQPLCGG